MTWQPPRIYRNLYDPLSGFQVLGERNSGTNFVSRLLAQNLPSAISARDVYGWKHGFIDRREAAQPGQLTVLVYRHPLRWLQSVHATPLHLSASMKGLTFSQFIRTPWQGAFPAEDGSEELSTADLAPKTRATLPTPMALRNAKVRYFEEMTEMPARMVYVRFEDANRDPQATLAAIADAFDLTLEPYSPVVSFKGERAKPYVPKLMPRIDAPDLDFIRSELNLSQERHLGYDLDAVPRFDGLSAWDRRSLTASFRALKPRWGRNARPGKA